MHDLGTLNGTSGFSYGYGINASGEVTGYAQTAEGSFHAFLYSGGVMQDLGSLEGPSGSSFGFGINDSGEVVGSTITSGSLYHAFLHSGGVMHDLNTLYASLLSDGSTVGFTELYEARDINNLGQITGYGTYFTGQEYTSRAFLLDPHGMQEPAVPDAAITLGLLAIAAAALTALRRRR
jgi:probable HAF family extracellular repeat protein